MSRLSDVYKLCAEEGNTCPITTPKSVAFNAINDAGQIYYRNTSNDLKCDASTFKAPTSSNKRACFAADIPMDIAHPDASFFDAAGNPAGWAHCANENETCKPPVTGPVDILFGANKSFVYANANSVPCSVNVFGDPKFLARKNCYWRQGSTPSDTPITPITPPSKWTTAEILKWVILGVGLLILIIILIVLITKLSKHKKPDTINLV